MKQINTWFQCFATNAIDVDRFTDEALIAIVADSILDQSFCTQC